MQVGDNIWYITKDTTLLPQKAKILRLDTKTGNESEYLVRRVEDNFCTTLTEPEIYDTLEDAKEAKINHIEDIVNRLNKKIMEIREMID